MTPAITSSRPVPLPRSDGAIPSRLGITPRCGGGAGKFGISPTGFQSEAHNSSSGDRLTEESKLSNARGADQLHTVIIDPIAMHGCACPFGPMMTDIGLAGMGWGPGSDGT